MSKTSGYLSRILNAAESEITAVQLARILDVPAQRAASILRYWERAGLLTPANYDVVRRGRRPSPRYTLTPAGHAALYQDRTQAIGDQCAAQTRDENGWHDK